MNTQAPSAPFCYAATDIRISSVAEIPLSPPQGRIYRGSGSCVFGNRRRKPLYETLFPFQFTLSGAPSSLGRKAQVSGAVCSLPRTRPAAPGGSRAPAVKDTRTEPRVGSDASPARPVALTSVLHGRDASKPRVESAQLLGLLPELARRGRIPIKCLALSPSRPQQVPKGLARSRAFVPSPHPDQQSARHSGDLDRGEGVGADRVLPDLSSSPPLPPHREPVDHDFHNA